MINERSFPITFQYKGRPVRYMVYWMHISSYEIKTFYRIQAKTGNRDLVKVIGIWKVCSGPALPDDILKLVGNAIEQVEQVL